MRGGRRVNYNDGSSDESRDESSDYDASEKSKAKSKVKSNKRHSTDEIKGMPKRGKTGPTPKLKNNKAATTFNSEDLDLSKVDRLRTGYENDLQASTTSLGLSDSIMEVKALPAKNVIGRIEEIILGAIRSVITQKGLDYLIPSRSISNQMYIPELDRNVLKNDKMTTRSFINASMVHKTTITTKILQLVHNILQRGIHITKRDMFYTDVKLFVDQKNSDAVLDDVACMIGCSRTSLNVVASEKGVVVGRLKFREDGDLIDCSKMGIGGKGIPPILDRVTDIESDAKFVLLVEKDAAFIRLSEDRFYQKLNCIIITAKGQPDVATRVFLRRLRNELNIPVLALVDSDPYGLNILSVYMSGSKKMSYDSASLVCPDIKWLGVRPSDLDRYNIPEECRLPMTPKDIERGQELLKEDFIRKNPAWVKELVLMLKSKQKAEIQALSTFGFQFLTQVYLPQKISEGDWI